MAGKWHLGLSEGSRPNDHGFDDWFGFLAGCIDYYSHIFYWGMNQAGPAIDPTHDLWHNDQEVWDNGRYLTELITEKAIDYIRECARRGRTLLSCTWATTRRTIPCTRRRSTWTALRICPGIGR